MRSRARVLPCHPTLSSESAGLELAQRRADAIFEGQNASRRRSALWTGPRRSATDRATFLRPAGRDEDWERRQLFYSSSALCFAVARLGRPTQVPRLSSLKFLRRHKAAVNELSPSPVESPAPAPGSK